MANKIYFDSLDELYTSLTNRLRELSHKGKNVHIALSGGSTPKNWFASMAGKKTDIRWSNLTFWWGDERMVPLSDPESNAGEALRLLPELAQAKLKIAPLGLCPAAAAQGFGQELLRSISKHDAQGNPVLDWCLLGIGEDGHTASLFPHENYPDELCVPAQRPSDGQWRVSFGWPVLTAAAEIGFLCTGASKRKVLHGIWSETEEAQAWPATQLAQKRRDAIFWVDQMARP